MRIPELILVCLQANSMITKNRVLGLVSGSNGTEVLPGWECTSRYFNPLYQSSYAALMAAPEYQVGHRTTTPTGNIVTRDTGFEEISYTVKRLHNACTHIKRVVRLAHGAYPAVYENVTGDGTVIFRINGRIHDPAVLAWFYTSGFGGVGSPFPELTALSPLNIASWREAYANRAVQVMWPGSQAAEMSVVNFLLELKDFATLRSTAVRLRAQLKRAKPWGRVLTDPKVSAKNRLRAAHKLLKVVSPAAIAAEANLTYSFAIAPFVSDVRGFYRAVSGLKSECERLRSHTKMRLHSHFRAFDGEDSTTTQTAYRNYGDMVAGRGIQVDRTVTTSAATYNATMEYSYDLSEGWPLEFLLLLDRLGLNLNPRVVWDALPWTFAVDWVCRVGDLLDRFKLTNVRPVVKILGFVHSVKDERTTKLLLKQPWDSPPNGVQAEVASQVESRYFREPYVPDYRSAIALSGVSNREFTLAASLGLLRYRSLSRTRF